MSPRASAVLLSLALVVAPGALARAADEAPTSTRMYPGAPPTVPHEVEDRKALCQECHATPGSGAPQTPHPTRVQYCLACHVPQDASAAPLRSPLQPR